MIDYSEDVAAATEDITEAGRAVQIERKGAPGGTSSNPTPGAVTLHATHSVFFDYKSHEIDGTVIMRGDVKALTHVLDIVPEAGDVLVDGATRYAIIDPGHFRPGDTIIYHDMQVREV